MSTPAQRRAARRRVLPGFPKDEKFTTPEALAAYFAHDAIACLLCGKSYKKLGNHLLAIHQMDTDAYRAQFGIPWTYGVLCLDSRARYEAVARRRLAAGEMPLGSPAAAAAMLLIPRRDRAPVRDELTRRNLHAMNAGKTGVRAAFKRERSQARAAYLARTQIDRDAERLLRMIRKFQGMTTGKLRNRTDWTLDWFTRVRHALETGGLVYAAPNDRWFARG